METIRTLLGLWRLTPDASAFTDRPLPKLCDGACKHAKVTRIEDVFDFDVDSFGRNCQVLPEEYGDPLDDLFSAAIDIQITEKRFESSLAEGSTFSANPYENLRVIGMGGKSFREHEHDILRERLKADINATFEDFKRVCGANPGLPYDKSADMVYVRMARGFGWQVPVLMTDVLYEVIETRSTPDPVFKIPAWALSRPGPIHEKDPLRTWASNPNYAKYREDPVLFTRWPVEEFTPAEREDDEVFLETFKVLATEMSLADAASAARALR